MFGDTYEKKDNEFAAIPKGRYCAILENAKIEQTPKTGTSYLDMEFVIDGDQHSGRKIWHKLWFTEKAASGMTSQQLDNIMVFKKIGSHETLEAFLNKAAELVFELVGKKFEISVTGHQEWNGKEYPNTFLNGYLDMPNAAVQHIPTKSEGTVDGSEEIPF
jgi:hypothetical protein